MQNKLYVGLMTLLLLILPASTSANREPPIRWSPNSLNIVAFLGTTQQLDVILTTNQTINKPSVFIVPELNSFLSLETVLPNQLVPGQSYTFTFRVEVPTSTPIGIRDGTVHIRNGNQTIPHNLKVIIDVDSPTATSIPEGTAIPSADRLGQDVETGVQFVEGELLVGFQEEAPQEEVQWIIESHGGGFLGSIPDLNVYQVGFPGVTEFEALEDIIRELEAEPSVELATHSWILSIRKTPDPGQDPEWDSWDEQSPSGNNLAYEVSKLPSAWDITTGSESIKVGVIDTGFDTEHEDLRENIEFAGGLLIRSVDDHGTAVAGIIGAKGNNNVGISGVMWDTSLLLYSIEAPLCDGCMLFSGAIDAANAAINRGARIINYSGGYEGNSVIVSIQNQAWETFLLKKEKAENRMFVFAAGQTGIDDQLSSPSSLASKYSNVISVTEVALVGATAIVVGNHGSTITLGAIGNNFTVISPNNMYENLSLRGGGTSFATPLVTGVAGLLWSIDNMLNPAQVKQLIVEGALNGGIKVRDQNFYVLNAFESMKLLLEGDIEVARVDGTGSPFPAAIATSAQVDGVVSTDNPALFTNLSISGNPYTVSATDRPEYLEEVATCNGPGCTPPADASELASCDDTGCNLDVDVVAGTLTRVVFMYDQCADGFVKSGIECIPESTTFASSDRVQVSTGDGSNLNVRDSAGGTVLDQQPDAAFGTVIAGPVFADGLWWWEVDFDTGPDGWVAEDFLGTAPPLLVQSAYITFSVLNHTDPSVTVSVAVGPTVSVFNAAAPGAIAGHVVSNHRVLFV